MKTFFKLIHIIVISGYIITGNTIYDQILVGAIGVIGYIYAFTFTRKFSNALNYNSLLMSMFHWIFRTIVTVAMILITKPFFIIIKGLIGASSDSNKVLIAVVICASLWVLLAEGLKSKTMLKKNYW